MEAAGIVDAAAFGPYWAADVTRLLLCLVSMFLVMLCVRVAWMRSRAPADSPLRERSPWALLSYAGFAFIPTVLGFRNFGQPLDPLLTPIFALALFSGLFAAFGQVTIRLWTRPPTAQEREHDAG